MKTIQTINWSIKQTNWLISFSWKFEQLNKIIKTNEDNKNMRKIIWNECLIYIITEF